MHPNENQTLEISEYLAVLRRRIQWVAVPLVACLVLALLWTMVRQVTYASTAQVVINSSAAQNELQGQNNNVGIAERNLANEINFAQGDAVLRTVSQLTDREISINITRDEDNKESDILWFTATAETPQKAAADANVWAEAYVTTKKAQASTSIDNAVISLEQDRTKLVEEKTKNSQSDTDDTADTKTIDSQINFLTNKISDFKLASQLAKSGTAEITIEAQPSSTATSSSLPKILFIGGMLGLIVGIITALIIDSLDKSIKSANDLHGLDVPIIGLIPKSSGIPKFEIPLATMRHGDSPVAEAYRKMQSSIEFSHSRSLTSSILITSPNEQEGRSSTAVNIAWALSTLKSRVILADTDYRNPFLHKVFGCTAEPGISNHITEQIPLKQLALRVEDSQNNLILLPSGEKPDHPGQFISSPNFSKVIDNLSTQADSVIFDCPPLLPFSDSLTMAAQMDAVILVAKAGKTKRTDLESSIAALRQVGANITGICLVGCNPKETKLNKGFTKITPQTKTLPSSESLPVREHDEVELIPSSTSS